MAFLPTTACRIIRNVKHEATYTLRFVKMAVRWWLTGSFLLFTLKLVTTLVEGGKLWNLSPGMKYMIKSVLVLVRKYGSYIAGLLGLLIVINDLSTKSQVGPSQ